MNMKRVFTVLLAAVLAGAAPLTGCTAKEDSPASSKSAAGSSDSASAQGTKGGADLSGKGIFPIVKDKITLSVFAMKPSTVEDLNTNLFTQELEELTNIHINWQTTTSDGLKEKRNLLFASGDYPDIMLSAAITPEEQMLYGSQSVLVPLKPLIDAQCVALPRLMQEIDWLEPVITTPDGSIYALPQINECYHCTLSQKLWINTDWIGKLGMDMPTTTDEFEQLLLAFKTQDPNGNSKQDEIPLSGAITGWNTGVADFLMNAFIYNDGSSDGYRVRMMDGKVEMVADKTEFQEGLKWMNRLYAQGLFDPAAFTQPSDQLKQLGENSGTCILGAAAAGAVSAFTKTGGERSMMYETLPPLKGPQGTQTTYHNPYGYNGGAFAITSANQYPEQSIKWIDYLYSEAGTRRANEGREGTEWVVPEPGVKGIDGQQAEWLRKISFQDVQNITWQGMDLGAVTSRYRLSEVAGDPATVEGFEARMYNETQKYAAYQPAQVLPPLYIANEQIDEMAQIKGPLMDYIKQSMAKFITDEMDLDTGWASYLDGLNGLKAGRYVEILQAAYDASAFAKK